MDDRQHLVGLRAEMSSVCGMFALAMVMFDRTETRDILRLAVSSVGALGPYYAQGSYLVDETGMHSSDGDDSLIAPLMALGGADGTVEVSGAAWSWAFPMRALSGNTGYLVVSADQEPSIDQRFLLTTLAQLTGAALVSADLHRRERTSTAELGDLNARLESTNEQLQGAVTDLQQRQRIHEVLSRVAAYGGGTAGIADAVHDLTGLAVVVEDRFGNLLAWAGPGRPRTYPRPQPRIRAELLSRVRRTGRAMRHRNRIVAVAQPRDEVLGVLSVVDPGQQAAERDVFALEHGAVVLAMELAHQHALAEAELRLRRDLVDDLLSGVDNESAWARAAAIGHDLHHPHLVVVARWVGPLRDEDVVTALGRAASRVLGSALLTTRRRGAAVLVVPQPDEVGGRAPWTELHRAVASLVRSGNGSIGVGRPCEEPAELPRSYSEAVRALEVRMAAVGAGGATTFDELGIYRLLAAGAGDGEVRAFVREWLGPLIDHDAANRSDFVATLWQYYECGGNYDATARALTIHRSTLRYRLGRIRDLTGHDLGAVESRLNLHVASRAWRVLGGSGAGRDDVHPPE
ncbi:helix-turn-helix domain-containing protein [Pseudonocardia sp. KRD-184]|uniref:Helix-turn-helix domain-containing protein n=1 Tax=Pseudonocardia oceani TaxID=2792013 RepID=A0ABS6UGZ2_9PSEU|nr:helix-turn-helix domain-containing protein [Pseudonocardia oceani]MBW0088788.1 helix-turn-helix domain-containing protein [Pseudonocardia oceani]MBW0096387.1 helix-turn-helix domain-containing protein [Pseudonocardia oceani]MBW0107358.1 helix-turn-helix domain-containing protein [Pseudonocardia oceani]MBW0122455.1 helix-turn-helix domain-containing protein [Pseudonocardia oceani]MBW0131490.1 helix-turn-helix domain-containing protein [Pseudonocardia oceani]